MGLLSGIRVGERSVALVAAAGLALFALGLGFALDRGRPASPVIAPATSRAAEAPQVALPDASRPGLPGLDVMVRRLEAKVAGGNGTAEQWRLLGQTYLELGRASEARQAFERAAALAPVMPGVRAGSADRGG